MNFPEQLILWSKHLVQLAFSYVLTSVNKKTTFIYLFSFFTPATLTIIFTGWLL